jgi:DNA primase
MCGWGTLAFSCCPACGNEDERILVITPARGLFYCFDAKVGGDCLALVQHITGLDVQDAAQFLAPKEATVPQKTERGSQPAPKKEVKEFDPAAFASKLTFTDEVAELGLSEEDATKLGMDLLAVAFTFRYETPMAL